MKSESIVCNEVRIRFKLCNVQDNQTPLLARYSLTRSSASRSSSDVNTEPTKSRPRWLLVGKSRKAVPTESLYIVTYQALESASRDI